MSPSLFIGILNDVAETILQMVSLFRTIQ